MSSPADTSASGLWGMEGNELIARLIAKEQLVPQAQAEALDIVAVLERTNVGKNGGHGNTEKLLEDVLR